MLVLTLTDHGEPAIITLPDGRTITVSVQRGNGRVRIGFVAPPDIKIDRESIRDAKLNSGGSDR